MKKWIKLEKPKDNTDIDNVYGIKVVETSSVIKKGYLYITNPMSYYGWDGNIFDYSDNVLEEHNVATVLEINKPYYFKNKVLIWQGSTFNDNILLYVDDTQEGTIDVGDREIIEEIVTLRCMEKEQVSPKDKNEWVDTGSRRVDEDCTPTGDSCQCGRQYRWIEDGTICENGNKYVKEKYQFQEGCYHSWQDYVPKLHRIGKLLELDSELCGTHEYKEVWEEDCIGTDKYNVKNIYIKKKNETEWHKIDCPTFPLDKELIKRNSFDCGYIGKKTEYEYEYGLCADVVREKYPSITNIQDFYEYDIKITINYETLPFPENTDDTLESDIKWKEVSREFSIYHTYPNSCKCGYKNYEWRISDETICGSEIGKSDFHLYAKWYKWETCSDTIIKDEFEWRVKDKNTCDCGYRIKGYKVDSNKGYEYVCGDDINKSSGFVYYKTYYYEECTDGSNLVFDYTKIEYLMATHTTLYECVYDENTKGDTTKVTYRAYYDENTKKNEYVLCPDKIELSREEKSRDCGYREEWNKVGEICCGELSGTNPILNIIRYEGNWRVDNNRFTSNKINHSEITKEKIYFKCNASINVSYVQSSEDCYDFMMVGNVDKEITYSNGEYQNVYGSAKCEESGVIKVETPMDDKEHFIELAYKKDGSGTYHNDNVICTLDATMVDDCIEFSKYEKLGLRYSTDGGTTWKEPEVPKYKYGAIIEANSEECGYVPRLIQWKLLCPDVTYENSEMQPNGEGGFYDPSGCTICEMYQPDEHSTRAASLYALERKQYSTDLGKTWHDIIPLQLRTEKLLKYKCDKCGYVGDIFKVEWANEHCDGTSLVGDYSYFVSSDNGGTWTLLQEIKNKVKEINSDICKEVTE